MNHPSKIELLQNLWDAKRNASNVRLVADTIPTTGVKHLPSVNAQERTEPMKHSFQQTISVRHSERRWKVEGRPELGTYVAEWFTQHVVEVTVDIEALANFMGPRAVLSKSGKAIEARGHVVVKHLHVIAPTVPAAPAPQ